jgi:hypothetical protein
LVDTRTLSPFLTFPHIYLVFHGDDPPMVTIDAAGAKWLAEAGRKVYRINGIERVRPADIDEDLEEIAMRALPPDSVDR